MKPPSTVEALVPFFERPVENIMMSHAFSPRGNTLVLYGSVTSRKKHPEQTQCFDASNSFLKALPDLAG